jgi:kynurenine formamidase
MIRVPSKIVIALGTAIVSFASFALADDLRERVQARRILDLTHMMHEGMPYWPGGVPFKMIRLVDYDQGYRLHRFEMGENTGTHVDAPSHFAKGKRAIHEIPLADLVVPAVVIDAKARVAANPDYQLAAADIAAWEGRHGRIPAGSLAIMNTGWSARFASQAAYANQDPGQVMHFPGFGKDAAEALIARGVAGIGIDTLSLDHGPSKDFATHHLMLGANKYMVENLANLDALPPTGATVVIGVLPVKDGSQAQARVFALLP